MASFSNIGANYETAKLKANRKIININQFFPGVDNNIKIYKDRYTYLGDNTNDENVDKSSVSGLKQKQKLSETVTLEDTVFKTEVENKLQDASLSGKPAEWTQDRERKIIPMKKLVDDAVAEHYKTFQVAYKSGDLDKAFRKINKCIVLKRKEHAFFFHRAEIFFEMCDFGAAIANYKRALSLDRNNEEYWNRLSYLYLLYGQTLFDQKFFAEALDMFTRASEMQPNNVAYHTRNVACLAALGRHSECLALVNKRLETNANNPDLYVMRARLHFIFKNFTLSYYDLKDALALNLEHEEAKKLFATFLETAKNLAFETVHLSINKRYREALKKINLAIDMDPSVADFHVRRGALHRHLGDFNAAIEDYLLALDKCDHDESTQVYKDAQRQLLLTFNDFAVECFLKGYYEESVGLLNKALKSEKNEKSLYINRGDCFYKLSEYIFALEDYQQASDLDPEDQSIQTRISYVYHQMGQQAFLAKDFEAAIVSLTSAIKCNPQSHFFWSARSRARYFMDDILRARVDIGVALLLSADINEAMITLLSRLFPGQEPDMANVLTLKLQKKAEKELLKYWRDSDRESVKSNISNKQSRVASKPVKQLVTKSFIPSLRECIQDHQLFTELLDNKKTITESMKKFLHQPQIKLKSPQLKQTAKTLQSTSSFSFGSPPLPLTKLMQSAQ